MKKDSQFLPPFVLEDTRGKNATCSICQAKYGLLQSEHICKRCMRSICDDCIGSLEHPVVKSKFKRSKHKICRSCKNEFDILDKYVQLYRLSFFQNSPFAEQWLKKSEGKKPNKKKKTSVNYSDEEQLVSELWQSLNFSMKEFVVLVAGDLDKKLLSDILQRVISITNRLVSYLGIEFQQVVYLVLMLSAHCNQETTELLTFEIYTTVIEEVKQDGILEYIRMKPPKMIKPIEKKEGSESMSESSILDLMCPDIEAVEKLADYLDYRFKAFQESLGLNLFSVQFSIFIVNLGLSRRSGKEIEKCLAGLLLTQMKYILRNSNKPEIVSVDILRNSSSNGVGDMIRLWKQWQTAEVRTEVMAPENAPVKKQQKPDNSKAAAPTQKVSDKQKEYKKQIQQLRREVDRLTRIINEYEENEDEGQEMGGRAIRHKRGDKKQEMKVLQDLLLEKNSKIDEMQLQRDNLNQKLGDLTRQVETLRLLTNKNDDEKVSRQEVKARDEQIGRLNKQLSRLNEEKKNMMHMNELLMKKFNELSRQLMDKEENTMKERREELEVVEAQVRQAIQSYSSMDGQNQQQCLSF